MAFSAANQNGVSDVKIDNRNIQGEGDLVGLIVEKDNGDETFLYPEHMSQLMSQEALKPFVSRRFCAICVDDECQRPFLVDPRLSLSCDESLYSFIESLIDKSFVKIHKVRVVSGPFEKW